MFWVYGGCTTELGGDEMTGERERLLRSCDRVRVERECRRQVRRAWPFRFTPRGRIVVRANVATLRDLRSLSERG